MQVGIVVIGFFVIKDRVGFKYILLMHENDLHVSIIHLLTVLS